VALREAEQVVVDEHLAVAVRAGADPDRRHREPARHFGRDGRRHSLEHDREATGLLERDRVVDQPSCRLRRLALRLEAAEHRRRLRRQANVPHHRNPGTDDCAHA